MKTVHVQFSFSFLICWLVALPKITLEANEISDIFFLLQQFINTLTGTLNIKLAPFDLSLKYQHLAWSLEPISLSVSLLLTITYLLYSENQLQMWV